MELIKLISAKGTTFWINRTSWQLVLQLAEMYGFSPLNSVESLAKSEAARLAAALERSHNDIPDQDRLPEHIKLLMQQSPARVTGSMTTEMQPLSPLEWFSGFNQKRWLRSLMAFCREGTFRVENNS